MFIIHYVNKYHGRLLETTLTQHLHTMPVVVVLGARQTGKRTLVQIAKNHGRRYKTLDDLEALAVLSDQPNDLLSNDGDLTLVEVQRFPQVLLDIKRRVNQERRYGRYLLTASANLLRMSNVTESLAGRASYLTLWPMSRREQLGLGACGIWGALISNREKDWIDLVTEQSIDEIAGGNNQDWRAFAKRGGYPIPALELEDEGKRSIWFDDYMRTYIERDVRQLTNISNLIDFRRLTLMACHRIGEVVNQTELGRSASIPQPTVYRYLDLLETSYQLVRVPAYVNQRAKRLIKSPKLYWSDTGLALSMAGVEPTGAHFENLILCDLLVWRDSSLASCDVFHWRTTDGVEVDFVLETSSGLIPIEVKATTNPRLRDTTSLRTFQQEYDGDSRAGLLLHSGSEITWLTNNVLAVPWWRIL